jgi:putative transposase
MNSPACSFFERVAKCGIEMNGQRRTPNGVQYHCLYRINGVEDHLHILTHIHPTVALSSLIKDIKLASNSWIKQENLFPTFKGWQEGYGAFTHHCNDKNRLIDYIKNQEVHHRHISWPEELKALLEEHGIPFDEKYLL